MAVSTYTGFIPERLTYRLTNADAYILHGVMIIDMQVSLSMHLQINYSMARNLFKHVFEKRNSGIEIGLPASIEV